jgi:hypothetical protein
VTVGEECILTQPSSITVTPRGFKVDNLLLIEPASTMQGEREELEPKECSEVSSETKVSPPNANDVYHSLA